MGSEVVVTIDPSSTRTGYAIMDQEKVVRAAAVRIPGKLKPPVRNLKMAYQVASEVFLARVYGDWVTCLIEYPSSRVYGGRPGTGLAVFGDSVGVIRTILIKTYPEWKFLYVTPDVWAGGHSKDKRRRVAEVEYPAIKEMRDPGGDIADAVALAAWYRDGGEKRCLAGG